MKQLEALKPAKHELLQLTSIRATVCACQKPLQDFLDKISKFERRLGAFNAGNQKWKGLGRRLQFRVMYKDDIKELKCFLSSHIATINILLMTQATSSISLAENDRHEIASGLESNILAHRRLLEDINGKVDLTLRQQHHTQDHLHQHCSALEELRKKDQEIHDRLRDQTESIQAIHSTVEQTARGTQSLLASSTETLATLTSGFVQLRQLSQQICLMLQTCATFTSEMRAGICQVRQLFLNIQMLLQRIDHNIPQQPLPPIVRLTTALGETMALPYQLCRQWTTFTDMLKVIFKNRPGSRRVLDGMYLIMNTRRKKLLQEDSWPDAVSQNDHLSMSITLDQSVSNVNICPFPSCQSTVTRTNAGSSGIGCKRHACGLYPIVSANEGQHVSSSQKGLNQNDRDFDEESKSSQDTTDDKEDLEAYRHINVRSIEEHFYELPSERGRVTSYRWVCHECGADNSYHYSPRCTSGDRFCEHEVNGCLMCTTYIVTDE